MAHLRVMVMALGCYLGCADTEGWIAQMKHVLLHHDGCEARAARPAPAAMASCSRIVSYVYHYPSSARALLG